MTLDPASDSIFVTLTAMRWLPTGLTVPALVLIGQARGLVLAADRRHHGDLRGHDAPSRTPDRRPVRCRGAPPGARWRPASCRWSRLS